MKSTPGTSRSRWPEWGWVSLDTPRVARAMSLLLCPGLSLPSEEEGMVWNVRPGVLCDLVGGGGTAGWSPSLTPGLHPCPGLRWACLALLGVLAGLRGTLRTLRAFAAQVQPLPQEQKEIPPFLERLHPQQPMLASRGRKACAVGDTLDLGTFRGGLGTWTHQDLSSSLCPSPGTGGYDSLTWLPQCYKFACGFSAPPSSFPLAAP
jgi:hypothetical protein